MALKLVDRLWEATRNKCEPHRVGVGHRGRQRRQPGHWHSGSSAGQLGVKPQRRRLERDTCSHSSCSICEENMTLRIRGQLPPPPHTDIHNIPGQRSAATHPPTYPHTIPGQRSDDTHKYKHTLTPSMVSYSIRQYYQPCLWVRTSP